MKSLVAICLCCVSYSMAHTSNIPGVDCSGLTDSSAALNSLFANLTNKAPVLPEGCQIRADHRLLIQGQESFALTGAGERPVFPGGASIFGCNGEGGALLTINRSGHWRLAGFGVYPQGIAALCPSGSNFTRSVDIDNSGMDGFTTTSGIIERMAFTSNIQGRSIPGYIGVNITGTPNTEHMELRNNWINCENAAGSQGIRIAGQNSDNDLAEGNEITNCWQAIRQEIGNIRIIQNHFGENGNYSVFGPGGAQIYVRQCVSGPMNIYWNEESDGGPFINSNDDQNGGCTRGWNVEGNIIGVADIGPTQYPVNLGTAWVTYRFIGNDVYVFPTKTTKSAIGSDSQNACQGGPLGKLIDEGNFNSFPANTGGWSGCVGGPDFQSGHWIQ